MRIIVGLLQIIVGLLFAVGGAILCFFVLFGERPDWVAVIIAVLMLLGGVSCIWTGFTRVIRG